MHHSSSFVLVDDKNCQVSWDYKYLIIICMLRTINLALTRTFIKPELVLWWVWTLQNLPHLACTEVFWIWNHSYIFHIFLEVRNCPGNKNNWNGMTICGTYLSQDDECRGSVNALSTAVNKYECIMYNIIITQSGDHKNWIRYHGKRNYISCIIRHVVTRVPTLWSPKHTQSPNI